MKSFEFSKKGFEQARQYKRVKLDYTTLILLGAAAKAFINIGMKVSM